MSDVELMVVVAAQPSKQSGRPTTHHAKYDGLPDLVLNSVPLARIRRRLCALSGDV